LETEATLFLYLKFMEIKDKDYHTVELHKPMKTKDGYTLYTIRIVSGPPPPKTERPPKKRWS